jgi:hypothetical protein
METVWNDLGVMVVASGFARRLERQRDDWYGAFLLATKRAGDAGELLVELKRQRDELLEALEDIAFGTVIKRAPGGCGQQQLWTAAQMSQHAADAIAAVKGGDQ